MKKLHFAGYNFESGPSGTVIHRPKPSLPKWFQGEEYGHDPVLNADGSPTGYVRMVPTGRLVRLDDVLKCF